MVGCRANQCVTTGEALLCWSRQTALSDGSEAVGVNLGWAEARSHLYQAQRETCHLSLVHGCR